jgi:DNA-binding transcriptional ArsR family regulator
MAHSVVSAKANLIMHPIRLRIVQALLGDRQLTPQQLADLLPDVPQATLYRHINKLVDGGVLVVAAERRARGAVEKFYAVSDYAVTLTAEDFANASRDDHMHAFTTFVASLLADFGRYLQRDAIDFERDGVGYRQVALYLNDEEFVQMAAALNTALRPFLELPPAPDRRRRMLSNVLIPTDEELGANQTENNHGTTYKT